MRVIDIIKSRLVDDGIRHAGIYLFDCVLFLRG